ncbi:RNA polymerase II-associated factor 1 homolog [Dysidea avara]|uniref:RNA polymerase II-associated factor 1 homolog n=1 Tax=Dysidea avara TaxID=196820 RepID=UPI00332B1276
MPTTTQPSSQRKGVGVAGAKRSAPAPKPSGSKNDLLVTVKYTNNLPDVPFDPKYISYPFDPNRFVQYNPTSLERNYKHELLTEVDLGVPIDLILPETYPVDHASGQTLHETDEKLLEEEVAVAPESKRARQHAKSVSWLRRTEYISTEYNRSHTTGEGVETKVGYSVKKRLQDTDIYKDRASQITAIEQTFEAAKQPITKHYSKPGVVAKEVLPVFPDFELWKFPFAQVIFDSDPAVSGTESLQQSEMSQAMIRGMMDENNEQFVAYFLPTKETLTKRHQDDQTGLSYQEDETYEYKMAREYNWNVKNKASKGYEETYFLVVQPDHGVFYNEIETRVRLSKRRARANSLQTALLVKHRDLTEDETFAQESRLTQLEPPVIEEEGEMADEEREIFGGEDDDEQSDSQTTQSDDNANNSSDND